MTDSENSQPQEESDDDIYKDIPEFNFEDELAKLEGSKETYKQEANDLSAKVKILTEENKELRKSNEVLKKNLSTLLKTAQAEVQRKDSMIEELRGKVESFTFRRNKPATIDKCTSTYDLEINVEAKYEIEKEKTVGNKKKSKSHDNWTSDNERKSNQEEKKKEFLSGKEENVDCDNNNRKSDYYRENSKNFRHSDNSYDTYNDRHKERKPTRFEDNSGYRRSYRENYRDHLKYDSFDKKRHSKSSEGRFSSCRRSSRERRVERGRDDSFDRRRKRGESSERCRSSRKGKSRSRDIYRRSKESSLEKQKNRSSLDIDLVKTKEQVIFKSEMLDCVKNTIDSIESKKRVIEENETLTSVKNKQVKEKRVGKSEKRSNLDIFSTKSPLDALYNDMITSRSTSNFLNSKPGTNLPESDLEEGELSFSQTTNIPETQPEEDWCLSFKNERQNDTKPMTLYSRRMMRKYSSEIKVTEKQEIREEKVSQGENEKTTESNKVEKIELEKEPGELTDDEHIVESSKEFQELTKVASIESELTEKLEKEETFKESVRRESCNTENLKTDSVLKESKKEMEKPATGKEELNACKEIEPNKSTHEVIEFSPFKSNYKLIEISPVKTSGEEHVLDFYNRRVLPAQVSQKSSANSSEEILATEKNSSKSIDVSEEKDSWKNSSSEKESETELKIIIPFENESPKKQEKKQEKEKKEARIKSEKRGVEELKCSKEIEKKKRKPISKKETEKPAANDRNRKRKRKLSETYEESPNPKKKKTEKVKPSRKSTRSKRNSRSESESNSNKFETEPKPVQEPETNIVKEDISSFEFFKPVAKFDTKSENPITFVETDKSACTTTDYKMTATMSVSGVVRLETPNKCVEKLKNLIINEQMIFNILDSKNNSQFSPLIGSKCIEMTPRRILKNDLMLTDSEDDSINKKIIEREDGRVEEDELDEEKGEISENEFSECDSDSGASDFVDLL